MDGKLIKYLLVHNVVIIFQGNVDVNRKKGCDWILVSHDQVDPEEAWKLLEQSISDNLKTEKNVLGHSTTEVIITGCTDDGLDKIESNLSSETGSSQTVNSDESSHLQADENAFDTDNAKGVVTLKFEPFILHVQCRDVDSAKILHTQR